MMGDYGTFLGKSRDVRCLLLKIAERNKQGEINILVTGRLDHQIQLVLDIFPDAVSPWFDDHATSNFRVFREISGPNHLLIPFREIFCSGWGNSGSTLCAG